MAVIPPYLPEAHPIADAGNRLRITRPWLLFFQQLLQVTSATGSGGTVTTTGSPSTGSLSMFSGATSITNADAAAVSAALDLL